MKKKNPKTGKRAPELKRGKPVLVQRVVSQRIFDKCRDAVPTTWLDPLLTGPNKVVGEQPYKCKDIVALCEGIRDRIRALANDQAH